MWWTIPVVVIAFDAAIILFFVTVKRRIAPMRSFIVPISLEAKAPKAETAPPPPPQKKTKLSYKDQRDYDLLPGKIEELEAAIARDEAALSDPALCRGASALGFKVEA